MNPNCQAEPFGRPCPNEATERIEIGRPGTVGAHCLDVCPGCRSDFTAAIQATAVSLLADGDDAA